MTLRRAREEDLPFVLALQDRPENDAFIGRDDLETLGAFLTAPAVHLMVSDTAKGFALIKGPSTSNVVNLQRLAIAEPGQGRGQQMLRDIIEFTFHTLDAHRLWLDVITQNARARRAYEKAGFLYEGTLRQHWRRRSGDLVDVAIYGLLREDRA